MPPSEVKLRNQDGVVIVYTNYLTYARNMRIRSYSTDLNLPSIRFMREKIVIMRAAVLRVCDWLVMYGDRFALEGGGCKYFPAPSSPMINLFFPQIVKGIFM